jgi:dipeptidyl aminopeptidase/acylaminoacyl peptidase
MNSLVGASVRNRSRYTCAQFLATAKISGLAFSPREDRILFTSDASGVSNAYEVSIADARQTQLTFSRTENIQSVSYFPKDDRILLIRDRGDVENSILYVLDHDGKETILTHGSRVQTRFHDWSSDLETFYMSTNERDNRFFDLYKVHAGTYERRLLFLSGDRYYFSGISADERLVLFVKSKSMSSANIFLYDLSRERMRPLIVDEGEVLNCLPVFDRDARALYYITDKASNFRYVTRRDLLTGESTCVEMADGDVGWTSFSPDYKKRITFLNHESNTRRTFRIHDQVTGVSFSLPVDTCDSITSALLSRSGRRLAFYLNGDRTPGNIHIHDFESGSTRALTTSLNPKIDREDLVESEVVTFRSFDGLKIPCLLWRPHSARFGYKAPALVWVHGGPGGRMVKGYKGRIQFLVNNGYVVLGVNYRGSSGFGKDFLLADRGKHGREPLWDCVMAKEYLTTLDYVDSSNIGIIGASFGGFMVLAALTFAPGEFAAGVDICGPSNLLSLADSLPPYWDVKRFYDKLGDLDKGRAALKEISPVFYADRIKSPLMILQGARDPRCPKVQSDEMVQAIRKTGGTVEYLVFEDEAHGFRKRKNAIDAYEAILKFLNSNLRCSTVEQRAHELSIHS